jgi:hypothetical protein
MIALGVGGFKIPVLACIEGQLQVETTVNWIDSIVWGFPRKLCNTACPSFKINRNCHQFFSVVNPLNAELNPICYLLALLGAHHFLHVSRIRVNCEYCSCCCSAMEQCVFSWMCRGSSKYHGMVMCVLNSGIIFSFCDGEGLFFPTHHTSQILLTSNLRKFWALKMPSLGKGLRLMTRLLKKWRSGCRFRIQTYAKRRYMLLFVTGASLFSVMEMV